MNDISLATLREIAASDARHVPDEIFQTIRNALKPYTEIDSGSHDHTERFEVTDRRFVWTRELYDDGQYFDVTITLLAV